MFNKYSTNMKSTIFQGYKLTYYIPYLGVFIVLNILNISEFNCIENYFYLEQTKIEFV